MLTNQHSNRRGFTLVEIMIVVAIIALLASIAVPSFLRARKRAQATSSLEACRQIDGAKEQYAIENFKAGTVVPGYSDLVVYIKRGSRLYNDLIASRATDALGGAIAINAIDTPPQIAGTTKTALADALGATPDDFWGAYK
ncbi:MAG TPA: prepilin-type N-terminal cleavage/methylation domain-containing protein [Chthoniobacteraceae bacterium]|jgi:prepilin-type N-terminal cleavage/methylation domain-containing protein|nr:prepilin-type N-terminal cleavage/methylation domain-containing protein [Chthoniobacteraceae bacterium]